jgi:hypothetical protein
VDNETLVFTEFAVPSAARIHPPPFTHTQPLIVHSDNYRYINKMSCVGNALEDPTAFSWNPDLTISEESSGFNGSAAAGAKDDSSLQETAVESTFAPGSDQETDVVSTSAPGSDQETDVVSTSAPGSDQETAVVSTSAPGSDQESDVVSTSAPGSDRETDVVSTSPPVPTWFWYDEDPGQLPIRNLLVLSCIPC